MEDQEESQDFTRSILGAEDGIRTSDPHLGQVMDFVV